MKVAKVLINATVIRENGGGRAGVRLDPLLVKSVTRRDVGMSKRPVIHSRGGEILAAMFLTTVAVTLIPPGIKVVDISMPSTTTIDTAAAK